jgi:hypothetical protein
MQSGKPNETEESGAQDKEEFSSCAFLVAALGVFAILV